MKEVKIYIPHRREKILDPLWEKFQIKPIRLDLGEDVLFMVTIEDAQSNALIHELRIRGVSDIFGSIMISKIDTYLSSVDKENELPKSAGANVNEILSVLEDSSVMNNNFISLVILSAILASFGLVDNNVVIIIGSMIVAPLMGPIALTSLGALLPGKGYLIKGFVAEITGLLTTVVVGYLVGVLVGIGIDISPTPELLSRSNLNAIVVVFSLVSGIAAGLIIAKGSNVSIVGVAIAASLAPPAAAIGLFLAASMYLHALQATLLLSLNILSINVACSITFLAMKLHLMSGGSKRQSERASRSTTILALLASFLLLIVVIISLSTT